MNGTIYQWDRTTRIFFDKFSLSDYQRRLISYFVYPEPQLSNDYYLIYGSYYSKNKSNRQTYIDYTERGRDAIIRAFLE